MIRLVRCTYYCVGNIINTSRAIIVCLIELCNRCGTDQNARDDFGCVISVFFFFFLTNRSEMHARVPFEEGENLWRLNYTILFVCNIHTRLPMYLPQIQCIRLVSNERYWVSIEKSRICHLLHPRHKNNLLDVWFKQRSAFRRHHNHKHNLTPYYTTT